MPRILTVLFFLLFWPIIALNASDKPEYVTIKKNISIGECHQDNADCLDIQIAYPYLKEVKAFDWLNKKIKEQVEHELKKFVFSYKKENSAEQFIDAIFEDFLLTTNELDFTQKWSIEITSSLIFASAKVISINTSIYSYTGGAHPNSWNLYQSYNLNNQQKIILNDLIKDKPAVTKIAERYLRREREIPDNQTLNDYGFYLEGDFYLSENFCLSEQGLIFHYNSYEIGPYVMGPSQIIIPYEELPTGSQLLIRKML